MPKLINEPAELIRVHVMMSKSDWTLFSSLFGDTIGTSRALRLMMRDYLKRLERRAEETHGMHAA